MRHDWRQPLAGDLSFSTPGKLTMDNSKKRKVCEENRACDGLNAVWAEPGRTGFCGPNGSLRVSVADLRSARCTLIWGGLGGRTHLSVGSFQVLVWEAGWCVHRLHLSRSHDSRAGGKSPLLIRVFYRRPAAVNPRCVFVNVRTVRTVGPLDTFLLLILTVMLQPPEASVAWSEREPFRFFSDELNGGLAVYITAPCSPTRWATPSPRGKISCFYFII